MEFIAHNLDLLGSLEWLGDNWGWIAAFIVTRSSVSSLSVFADTKRFSLKRVWAISGVCFDESIRKRVLWITPLAIIGVIGITQFQPRYRRAGRGPAIGENLPVRHRPGCDAHQHHSGMHEFTQGNRKPGHLHDPDQANYPARIDSRQSDRLCPRFAHDRL